MGYFDDEKNVEQYIKMAEGYDGRELIPFLRQHLADGSTILELGMGPGTDLELLGEHYQATGSDYSAVFVNRYKQAHPTADVLILDAIKMDIQRSFDCIYSNKVLHMLTKKQLQQSFERQAAVLNNNGLLFHTFWAGDYEEEIQGMRFVYHTAEGLADLLGSTFKIIDTHSYTEMGEDDSLLIVAQKQTI